MLMFRYLLSIVILSWAGTTAAYDLLHDYSGQTFFTGWDFYGNWDNLTLGNVTYLTALAATEHRLAFVTNEGSTIIRVDNFTNVAAGERRNSVRITTQEAYDFGSLWIVDLTHIPYGCSVWPAFWSTAPDWPVGGEIDVIEAINLMPDNQMALHTTAGCYHGVPPNQLGYNIDDDCGAGSGCTVGEPAPNSYGSGFAAAGGGVFATQFDATGIYMWFWSRPDIPAAIANATANSSMDPTTWGTPTASYPTNSSCNITEYFKPQQLIFDITLCGDWAGVPGIYDSQCYNAGPTHTCYYDNVVGNGSNYDNAYFEVNYVRTYTDGVVPPASTSTTLPVSATGQSTQARKSGARGTRVDRQGWLALLLGLVLAICLLLLV